MIMPEIRDFPDNSDISPWIHISEVLGSILEKASAAFTEPQDCQHDDPDGH